MTAPDSSVLVAGHLPSHRFHRQAVDALADIARAGCVATLDRRDFSAVRPRHCEALRLLPD